MFDVLVIYMLRPFKARRDLQQKTSDFPSTISDVMSVVQYNVIFYFDSKNQKKIKNSGQNSQII